MQQHACTVLESIIIFCCASGLGRPDTVGASGSGDGDAASTDDFVHEVGLEDLPEDEQDAARRILESLRSCKTCGLRSFVDQCFQCGG